MKWIEVKVETSHQAVEIVSNILHEAGAGGVVIQDPEDMKVQQGSEGNWDYIDESLWQEMNEDVYVKGYLPETPDLPDEIKLIQERVSQISEYGIDPGVAEVITTEVYEEDWSTSWKKYYKPTKVGNHIVIKPTWEKYQRESDEHIIELDPGMAFGTGTHETTRLCIQFLEEHVTDKTAVLDIGTGTGILGIAAAKLGGSKVIGVDIDPVAVKVARENIAFNHVEDIVEVRQGDLFDKVREQVDIVVANIIADVIIELSKNIRKVLKKDGIFIASGIILDRLEDVKEVCRQENIKILSIKEMGEWAALCLTVS